MYTKLHQMAYLHHMFSPSTAPVTCQPQPSSRKTR